MDESSVLVTGGTGFVGSHLVEVLLQRGFRVTCLIRRTSDRRYLQDPRLRLVETELCGNAAELARLVSGHQRVFHLAGAVRALDQAGFLRANAQTTEELVEACLAAAEPPRRFVLVSSAAASGPPPEGERLSEAQPPRPVTEYGRSKLEGERRALRFAADLSLVIVRPGAIYGPRDRETLPLFRAARAGLLPALGGAGQVVNLAHVSDIVEGILLAGERPLRSGEVLLLGAEREHSLTEVAQHFERLLGRRVRLLPVPGPLLASAAFLAQSWARLRGQPAMLSLQKLPELRASWRFDLTAARERLGFSPRWTLEAGLADTLAWYRREGWLEGGG